MFYNLTAVIRYRDGILGAVDVPFPEANGTFAFNGAELRPAAIRLTEHTFAVFHFDLSLDPITKLRWLDRYSQALGHADFAGLRSVPDVAARCSGALGQVVPAAEVNNIPALGLVVAGLSSVPTRDFHIIGMHAYRRSDPNRPFSELVRFPANCYGGISVPIAQATDTKLFSRYFSRDQALRMLYLQYQISHRVLTMVGEQAPELDIVEVAQGIPFRRVPREDLASARKAASELHQRLDASCKQMSGALA
jgi:hypothetical protein